MQTSNSIFVSFPFICRLLKASSWPRIICTTCPLVVGLRSPFSSLSRMIWWNVFRYGEYLFVWKIIVFFVLNVIPVITVVTVKKRCEVKNGKEFLAAETFTIFATFALFCDCFRDKSSFYKQWAKFGKYSRNNAFLLFYTIKTRKEKEK